MNIKAYRCKGNKKRWLKMCKKNNINLLFNHEIYRIKTCVIECINNKIKAIKRIAYGFKDFEYFFLRLKSTFKVTSETA
ncbi:MAG: transposase [Succinivibrio sp.]